MGEVDRFKLYEHLKIYAAAPPDVLRVDEKNLREHSVLNVVFVVMTTNHKTDGIYLPADDRRWYVFWSECQAGDFDEPYWDSLYAWYNAEGYGHVSVYLKELDLSGFNPKAPPPKTDAFWAIVGANSAPEEAEIADIIDELSTDGQPIPAFTLESILEKAVEKAPKDFTGGVARDSFAAWLGDRKNRRAIPHRIEKCGYAPVRNPDATHGLWVIHGKRQVIYARTAMSVRERHVAAAALARYHEPPKGRTYNDRKSSTPDF